MLGGMYVRWQLLAMLLPRVWLPVVLLGCTSTTPPNPQTNSSMSASPSSVTPATASPITAVTSLKPGIGLNYKMQKLPNATAYIVTVPANDQYIVKPAVVNQLQPLAQIATSSSAIAAINGGFFDPANQQSTSYVVMDRQTIADPKQNVQLTENPNLKTYLRQIFDRSEFRRYDCGGQVSYGIQRHSQPALTGCQVVDAIGGGPQLLPELQSQREAFVDPELGRDAIGTKAPNARSAIGITPDQQILLVMIAQTKPGTGMTIPELATFMQSLGAETAMNLDGGSSSAMLYNNKSIFGKVDEPGNASGQAIKSAIVVTPK